MIPFKWLNETVTIIIVGAIENRKLIVGKIEIESLQDKNHLILYQLAPNP